MCCGRNTTRSFGNRARNPPANFVFGMNYRFRYNMFFYNFFLSETYLANDYASVDPIDDNLIGMQFHAEVDKPDVLRWIDEDLGYIESSLGSNAKRILVEQTEEYCIRSQKSRIEFLRRILLTIKLS